MTPLDLKELRRKALYNPTCETCGSIVEVEGKTTQYYIPILTKHGITTLLDRIENLEAAVQLMRMNLLGRPFPNQKDGTLKKVEEILK